MGLWLFHSVSFLCFVFLSHAFSAAITWCCFTVFILTQLRFSLISCIIVAWASWVCHITSCSAGPTGFWAPLPSFSLDFAGQHLSGLILLFHFWAFQDPFYSSRRVILHLCIAPLLKRVRGPTLGFVFYFQQVFFLFLPLLGPHLCSFLLFELLEHGPVTFSLPTPQLIPWADLGFSPHWAFGHGLAKTGINNSFDVDHVKIPYCLIFNFLKNLFLTTIFL